MSIPMGRTQIEIQKQKKKLSRDDMIQEMDGEEEPKVSKIFRIQLNDNKLSEELDKAIKRIQMNRSMATRSIGFRRVNTLRSGRREEDVIQSQLLQTNNNLLGQKKVTASFPVLNFASMGITPLKNAGGNKKQNSKNKSGEGASDNQAHLMSPKTFQNGHSASPGEGSIDDEEEDDVVEMQSKRPTMNIGLGINDSQFTDYNQMRGIGLSIINPPSEMEFTPRVGGESIQ